MERVAGHEVNSNQTNYSACENDCKDCTEENFVLEYARKKHLMIIDGE